VPALRRYVACPFAPWEVVLAQPLQYLELSFGSRNGAQAKSVVVVLVVIVVVFVAAIQVTSLIQLIVLMHELQRA
jgi:hypothetical protein